MISRRVCVGGLNGLCIDVRILGKGDKRVALLHSSRCLDVAISRVIRERKGFSKFQALFVSLTKALKIDPSLRVALYHGISQRRGVLGALIDKLLSMLAEFETVVMLECLRDTLPMCFTPSGKAENLALDHVCSCEDRMPFILAELAKGGKKVAWVWIPCGDDFSLEELEIATNIVESIVLGRGASERGGVAERECVFVESPVNGLFIPSKRVGEEIVEGERLGYVNELEILAPSDGLVAYISRGKEVVIGDTLSVIIRKTSL